MSATPATIKKEAARIRGFFIGQTFASKNDVANWMRQQSQALEKKGFGAADIFQILKLVGEGRR